MESFVLEGFVVITFVAVQWMGRRAARARALRERGAFLAERIDEVNQQRLLFPSGDQDRGMNVHE